MCVSARVGGWVWMGVSVNGYRRRGGALIHSFIFTRTQHTHTHTHTHTTYRRARKNRPNTIFTAASVLAIDPTSMPLSCVGEGGNE